MSDPNNRKPALIATLLGLALIVACLGLALSAIWTHGELSRHLAATAGAIGIPGFFLFLIGGLVGVES